MSSFISGLLAKALLTERLIFLCNALLIALCLIILGSQQHFFGSTKTLPEPEPEPEPELGEEPDPLEPEEPEEPEEPPPKMSSKIESKKPPPELDPEPEEPDPEEPEPEEPEPEEPEPEEPPKRLSSQLPTEPPEPDPEEPEEPDPEELPLEPPKRPLKMVLRISPKRPLELPRLLKSSPPTSTKTVNKRLINDLPSLPAPKRVSKILLIVPFWNKPTMKLKPQRKIFWIIPLFLIALNKLPHGIDLITFVTKFKAPWMRLLLPRMERMMF